MSRLINPPKNTGRHRSAAHTRKMLDVVHRLCAGETLKSMAIDEGIDYERRFRVMGQSVRRFCESVYKILHQSCPGNGYLDNPEVLNPRLLTEEQIATVFEDLSGAEIPEDIPALREAAAKHSDRLRSSR